MYLAYRFRPLFRPHSPEQTGLDRYRDAVTPDPHLAARRASRVRDRALRRHLGGGGVAQLPAVAQRRAASTAPTPTSSKDIGFYVFDLPWLHYLVDFAMAVPSSRCWPRPSCTTCTAASGCRPRTTGSPAPRRRSSRCCSGVFVLAKAADYWLDRFDLVTESGTLITGMTYTDDHAVLPAKNILMGIAVICAVLFFLNVWRRTWLLPSVGLALLVLSAILLGLIWPGIVQQFQVKPDRGRTRRRRTSRRTSTRPGRPTTSRTSRSTSYTSDAVGSATGQLAALAEQTSSVPLVDPQLVRQTFEQNQQVRAYYSVRRRARRRPLRRSTAPTARWCSACASSTRAASPTTTRTGPTCTPSTPTATASSRRSPTSARPTTRAESDRASSGPRASRPTQDALAQTRPAATRAGSTSASRAPTTRSSARPPGAPDVELDLRRRRPTSRTRPTTYDGDGGVAGRLTVPTSCCTP